MTDDEHPQGLAEWIYLNLYLGQAVNKFDVLILETIPKILALERFERWFFLRYLDEKGLHLRLRFKVPARHVARLTPSIRAVCEVGLEEMLRVAPTAYRPMVLPPGFDAQRSPSADATVGIVADTYEPELEKFGGLRGMPIAEEVFENSSRVALDILGDEARAQVLAEDDRSVFDGRGSRRVRARRGRATLLAQLQRLLAWRRDDGGRGLANALL